MINTAPPASKSAYGKEKWFWGNSWKLIFQNWLLCHCDALVKELLARADEPAGFDSRRRYFLFLCIAIIIFFFSLVFVFQHYFSFWPVFLYSHCWPCWSYISSLIKSGVLFWKRDFKSSWSAYWPSVRPVKTISCQYMSLLWKSWKLVDLMTNNTQLGHHKL